MIKVKNLSIKNNNTKLIEKLNVSFGKGEFWAIIGKNGAGKTTLLHTLAGFLKYFQGSIELNAQELSTINSLIRAQNISLLPQMNEANLNCTVEQSISYGRYPWHKDELAKKEDLVLVNAAIDSFELNHIRHNNIQQISGGELRRVEIATVIAQNSDVMMLDEPLNHLDLSFRIKLMKLLKILSKNKTIIMITHDIQYVQEYCSHVIMLLENSDVIVGPTNTVLNKDNLSKIL